VHCGAVAERRPSGFDEPPPGVGVEHESREGDLHLREGGMPERLCVATFGGLLSQASRGRPIAHAGQEARRRSALLAPGRPRHRRELRGRRARRHSPRRDERRQREGRAWRRRNGRRPPRRRPQPRAGAGRDRRTAPQWQALRRTRSGGIARFRAGRARHNARTSTEEDDDRALALLDPGQFDVVVHEPPVGPHGRSLAPVVAMPRPGQRGRTGFRHTGVG
jgi:hypothetical protein